MLAGVNQNWSEGHGPFNNSLQSKTFKFFVQPPPRLWCIENWYLIFVIFRVQSNAIRLNTAHQSKYFVLTLGDPLSASSNVTKTYQERRRDEWKRCQSGVSNSAAFIARPEFAWSGKIGFISLFNRSWHDSWPSEMIGLKSFYRPEKQAVKVRPWSDLVLDRQKISQ